MIGVDHNPLHEMIMVVLRRPADTNLSRDPCAANVVVDFAAGVAMLVLKIVKTFSKSFWPFNKLIIFNKTKTFMIY